MDIYSEISLTDSLSLSSEYRFAAHVMIYSKWPGKLFGKYDHKYMVMMQMRFDGMLGFPGGMVEEGESPSEAVTREFHEETGCQEGLVTIAAEDHVSTHHSERTQLCLHFFAKEVSFDLYVAVEKCPQVAKHWGTEVLGIIRCPMYTLPNGLGLPGFLRHGFIGNSLGQLQLGVVRRGLLTQSEWEEVVKISKSISGLVTKDEIDY